MRDKSVRFACQNVKIMYTVAKAYSRLEEELVSAARGETELSFHDLCRSLHVSPSSLEELLLRELGMTGEDIVDFYFGNASDFY